MSYGNPDGIRGQLKGWNAVVVKLLVQCEAVLKDKLIDHIPLESWLAGSKTVLLGDAFHPMLPYVAQAAAQEIKDAGALGSLFDNLQS